MERPALYFFPFTQAEPIELRGLEPGVLSRRIPDFLCLCLNELDDGCAEMLEIRETDEEGVPTGKWVTLTGEMDGAEAMELLDEEDRDATVLIGSVRALRIEQLSDHELPEDVRPKLPSELEVELSFVQGDPGVETRRMTWSIPIETPAQACLEMAEEIARELQIPLQSQNLELYGTESADAFYSFLQGLEGAAQLDSELLGQRSPVQTLSPFVQSLERDPDYALALRRFYLALQDGLSQLLLDMDEASSLLDQVRDLHPGDHEAATVIGEFYAAMNDLARAEAWLQVAVEGDDPPGTAIETLGILLANRGQTDQARNLWRLGVDSDGHPDFFAHLARLAFAEDNYDEAWDKMIRGLRRLGERSLHPGEWEEEEGRGGVLLRYLAEQLSDPDEKAPPSDVQELLLDLQGQIQEPSDRLDLGLCLIALGRSEEGLRELRASVPHVEDWERRDLGAQALAEELFPGFEERFAEAAEDHDDDECFGKALEFFRELRDEIPQFWPAHYFLGRLYSTAEDWENASEAFRVAAGLRRDQPEIWSKLAVTQHERGEVQDAIESMRQALELNPEDPSYYADLSLLYFVAGEEEESIRHLGLAIAIDEQHPSVHRAVDQLTKHGIELPDDLIPETEIETGDGELGEEPGT
jgi:tetratricopeptide (TPR) repeat protein